jgi:hypothetical protein
MGAKPGPQANDECRPRHWHSRGHAGPHCTSATGLHLSLNGEWNQIDLAEGSFTSNVYRGTAYTQFTPFIALVNIVRYDAVSRVLGWQSRHRWILTPGNDLYVVSTHHLVDDPLLDRFGTLDRRAASKVLYTHRF